MGVVIEGPNHGRVTIHGVGLRLKPPPGPLRRQLGDLDAFAVRLAGRPAVRRDHDR